MPTGSDKIISGDEARSPPRVPRRAVLKLTRSCANASADPGRAVMLSSAARRDSCAVGQCLYPRITHGVAVECGVGARRVSFSLMPIVDRSTGSPRLWQLLWRLGWLSSRPVKIENNWQF